ncbi:MAG: YraN family protein [Chloroflexi bacterium]|nr:YraN family protein [Chloroflexota bacterium]
MLASRRGANPVPDPRHELGERAEEATAAWLEARGWTILARRWRCREGELDLVARDPDRVLVGIEVKARRTGRAGSPIETINQQRLGRLRAALGRYCAEASFSSDNGLRIDLVAMRPEGLGQWRLSHQRGIDAW